MSQLCARSGITFKCASRATRLENISPSTCAEKASAPIRGSRLVGAESIKKFTVPESAEVFAELHPPSSSPTPHNNAPTPASKNPEPESLARVAVHQFPHNRRQLCPGSRRQIIRARVKRLISQHREGQRL